MNAIFKKLNFKNQASVYIVNSPQSFDKELNEIATETTVRKSVSGAAKISFFLGFVTRQNEVDDLARKISSLLDEDAVFWFAYPKGTSKKYKCEFNRDNGWAELGRMGFEPVRMVAIDEDWSALRFRKAENIAKMTRSAAISEKGKAKLKEAKKTGK